MYNAIIIGAGVVGSAVARALILKYPDWKIAVLEKEEAPGLHTSSRNSGVVHSGFNQKPGTLKAKLCVEGNRLMREYCKAHNVDLQQVGTLVVAQDAQETSVLEELLARGKSNGVPDIQIIDSKRLKELEPNSKGHAALYSPTGSIVDNPGFVNAVVKDAKEKGVEFFFNQKVTNIEEGTSGFKVYANSKSDPNSSSNSALNSLCHPHPTPSGVLGTCSPLKGEEEECGSPISSFIIHHSSFLINCASLYADKIAHMLDIGKEYTIVPFRGGYYQIAQNKKDIVKSMIYPAPDLQYPFLGVHWTKKVNGDVIIGPNAVIAFGRESYSTFDIKPIETIQMATEAAFWKMLSGKEFREQAGKQFKITLSKKVFVEAAKKLVPGVTESDFMPGPAGNRAQLIDKKGELIDDVLIERKGNSIHVLNAVSPGFTTSLSFASHLTKDL
ncbi:NAD(P)/FAD-dependent oxidoreductase [Elusimicrobiota bacterium]